MKFMYIKPGKFNYQGNQYRTGDILELDGIGNLPADWFRAVEKKPEVKPEKIIVEKPETEIAEIKTTKKQLRRL